MSGLVPLEDYEHALAHLQLAPSYPATKTVTSQQVGTSAATTTLSTMKTTTTTTTTMAPTRAGSQANTITGGETRLDLPTEIILEIGKCLFDAYRLPSPAWLATLADKDLVPPPMSQTPDLRQSYVALLHLSSTCIAYRALLAPLLWRSIYLRHPQQFGELLALMRNYPSVSAARAPSSSSSGGHELPFPLPLVRELHILVPDRFPGFDQTLLADLFRRGLKTNLTELEWEAEELPETSALRALAPTDDTSSKVNGEDANSNPTRNLGGLGAEVGAEDVVRWTRDARRGAPFPGITIGQTLRPRPGSADCTSLTSVSIDCKCFWPGHKLLAHLSSVRHLRLTTYDSFLLPPAVPHLLLSLKQPLASISMATSKTSLLHTPNLIEAGCFDNLVTLDIFPVTPEQPLARAIRRSRRSLKVLRLVLDVSSNFSNFDQLWRDLTGDDPAEADGGPMERLTTLHMDPMPQQNTAPSFAHFVQRGAPALKYVNGRHKDGFAPGYELLTPDDITSALYF